MVMSTIATMLVHKLQQTQVISADAPRLTQKFTFFSSQAECTTLTVGALETSTFFELDQLWQFPET